MKYVFECNVFFVNGGAAEVVYFPKKKYLIIQNTTHHNVRINSWQIACHKSYWRLHT